MVDRVKKTGRGPSFSYPWDKWLAQLRALGTLILVRGVDYDTSVTGLINQLRSRAKSADPPMRVTLRPSKDDSELVVTVKGKEKKGRVG